MRAVYDDGFSFVSGYTDCTDAVDALEKDVAAIVAFLNAHFPDWRAAKVEADERRQWLQYLREQAAKRPKEPNTK